MKPTELRGPVLIVEDDPHTAALVATYLQREGFATRTVGDGDAALERVRREPPGFVVLDVMLPGTDGWEICRELRRISTVPILMLTAREEEVDRVLGLSLGADDYVVKPFSPRELVERVKAILRRVGAGSGPAGQLFGGGDLVLDAARHRVTVGGRPVRLTAVEFKLLLALLRAPGRVLSRQELLDVLYGSGEAVVDRVVDVHIGHLRRKLRDDPAAPRYIATVRGFGYRFVGGEPPEREA